MASSSHVLLRRKAVTVSKAAAVSEGHVKHGPDGRAPEDGMITTQAYWDARSKDTQERSRTLGGLVGVTLAVPLADAVAGEARCGARGPLSVSALRPRAAVACMWHENKSYDTLWRRSPSL